MKLIKFEYLTIENFRSIGDEIKISFDNGINFISGYNKDQNSYNGVGKTTIIEAFFFALFGVSIKKTNKSNLINYITNTSAIVSLSYYVGDDHFLITRSLNPSSLELLKNDEDISKTMVDTNADICKSIDGDIDIYKNYIVMDSNSKGFLSIEPTKKIKFIEQLLSLTIFADMLKMSKDDLKIVNNNYIKESGVNSSLTSLIQREETNVSIFEKERNTKIENLKRKIDTFQNELKNIKYSDLNFNEEIGKIESTNELIKQRIIKAEGVYSLCNEQLKTVSKDLKQSEIDLKAVCNLICSACGQPLKGHSEQDINQMKIGLEAKKSENLLKNETVNKRLVNAKNAIKQLTTLKTENDLKISKLVIDKEFQSKLTDKINEITQNINNHNQEITIEKEKENPYQKLLSNVNLDLNISNDKLLNLSEDLKISEYTKFLCSPEGVKSTIINSIIDLINTKLDFYIKKFNLQYTCKFDKFFDHSITNEHNREVSYNDLSGGEQKRLDLSILFTFYELRRMQSNITTNVVMFDELFDSALDETGITTVLDILTELSKTVSIFIITHRKEALVSWNKTTDHNIIFLEKENGITRLSE